MVRFGPGSFLDILVSLGLGRELSGLVWEG